MIAKTVSVVIPVFNAEPFLKETIESILNQSYTDFELLLVDDCSTDNSLSLMCSYDDPRIRIFQNSVNHGPAYTQNKGFRNAVGKYIALHGADDISLPERLAQQVSYLETNPECSMLCTSYYTFTEDSSHSTGVFQVPDSFIFPWRMLLGNPIGASTVMFRRAILQHVGYFDETIPYGEDMDLWGTIASIYRIDPLDVVLVKYRVHSTSLSHQIDIDSRRKWQSLILKNKIALLAKVEVTEKVAGILMGLYQNITSQMAREACKAMENLAIYYGSILENKKIFLKSFYPTLLQDLWQLAWNNPSSKWFVLNVALRIGFQFSPISIISIPFIRFVIRLCLVHKSE